MISLICGGSGSGKSEYAEGLCMGYDRKIYLATMQPFGEEGIKRIQRHRSMRAAKGFETVEQYTNIEKTIGERLSENSVVLLECMSNLVANEMFIGSEIVKEEIVFDKVISGVTALSGKVNNLIIVSNDIFSDGKVYDEATEGYIRALARVNKQLAAIADEVVEVVFGCCNILKKNSIFMGNKEKLFAENHIENVEADESCGMILFIGGKYQGKFEAAGKKYPDKRIFDNFNQWVLNCLKSGLELETEFLKFLDENAEAVIICDEVGCGVVSTDNFENEYRETVGRLTSRLAKRASAVHRVFCGIDSRLK